jgi:hypothetical protein
MDTDNEPTKNEPQYVTDVDGNQVEKTSFTRHRRHANSSSPR